ncbi:MAG: DJ-1/PfpI family protein [Actinomycetaceae bacterium]|nr:DJ-1/PfpI family protein [Actinomycetaceae bacterium]MDU0970220.1 DJ-1/PfpI family protein [Actinomycetaceae bacterium]
MAEETVAILFAPGFEETEAVAPYDVLRRGEVAVECVAVSDDKTVKSSRDLPIVCTHTLAEVDLGNYSALVLPGGIPGMPNLKATDAVREALTDFAANGKLVAAICASPSILAELGLLTGRRATANPNFQHILTENGATVIQDEAVVDGAIITSKGAGTSVAFGLEILRYLRGDDAVAKVRKGMVLD